MSKYRRAEMLARHTTELTLSLPDEFKERTINVFVLNDDGPSEFNLVMSRDTLGAGESIQQYIHRQLRALSERVAGVDIIAQMPTTVDGQPAVMVDFTWLTADAKMHQRQVVATVPDSDSRQIVVFTATTAEMLSAGWARLLDEALASVKFRGRGRVDG